MSEYKRKGNNMNGQKLPEDKDELIALLAQAVCQQQNGGTGRNSAPRKTNGAAGEPIDLIEFFWYLVSKLHIIVIAAILGTLIGFVYAQYLYTPTYSATAKLYILNGHDSLVNLADLQLGNALGPDYTEVFNTWEVSEMVREELKLDYSYTDLHRMLKVSIPSNSRVLYLTVQSKDAQEAADVANAFANCGKRFIMEVMNSEEPNNFSMALVPGVPSTKGKTYYIEMGFLISTVLALGVFVLIHLLDNRPRSAENVAKLTGLPVLTVIPLEQQYNGKSRKHNTSKEARE